MLAFDNCTGIQSICHLRCGAFILNQHFALPEDRPGHAQQLLFPLREIVSTLRDLGV